MTAMSLVPLTRFSPVTRGLLSFRNELERLFGEEFSSATTTTYWAPRVNVHESVDALEISVDLPGVSRDDLSIQVENNLLILRGSRRDEKDDKAGTWHRLEKVYGQFERTFNLPVGSATNTTEVKAALKDGVLTVWIPKAEDAKPRQVEIRVD